jgi:hypothetical protein
MSAHNDDELEVDEWVARLADLVQKIDGDIAEGGYRPGTVLPALIGVAVRQLLECADPQHTVLVFVADLLYQFRAAYDMPDDDEDEEP